METHFVGDLPTNHLAAQVCRMEVMLCDIHFMMTTMVMGTCPWGFIDPKLEIAKSVVVPDPCVPGKLSESSEPKLIVPSKSKLRRQRATLTRKRLWDIRDTAASRTGHSEEQNPSETKRCKTECDAQDANSSYSISMDVPPGLDFTLSRTACTPPVEQSNEYATLIEEDMETNLHEHQGLTNQAALCETIDILMEVIEDRCRVWDLLETLAKSWNFAFDPAVTPSVLEHIDGSFDHWRVSGQRPSQENFVDFLHKIFTEECDPPCSSYR